MSLRHTEVVEGIFEDFRMWEGIIGHMEEIKIFKKDSPDATSTIERASNL